VYGDVVGVLVGCACSVLKRTVHCAKPPTVSLPDPFELVEAKMLYEEDVVGWGEWVVGLPEPLS
jgi:hypothetical protein